MLCAISGEAPQVPVASRKSGQVFERRLIEDYIRENGSDPVTGETLALEDLVELKTARAVKPRPPTLTSIPSLLSVLQNEWDALALETYTLKQHLSQLRQELAAALYHNDAATRVIARITKERDEARNALGKVSLQDRRTAAPGSNTNGDAMQVDGQGLPSALVAKVDATQQRLQSTRRKRPVPQEWATQEDITSMEFSEAVPILEDSGEALALDSTGSTALIGGSDGALSTFSVDKQAITLKTEGDGSAINDVVAYTQGSKTLSIVAKASGEVVVLDNDKTVATFRSHAGAATGLALHPCGDLLLSVGVDKSFVYYDLESMAVVSQVYTDSDLTCCQFHPDGHLFAAGTTSGHIKLFEVKTSDNAANFSTSGPVRSLAFSENGIWLAAVVRGSTTAGIWDLRKAEEIKTLEFGSKIEHIRWDYTGKYLVGAGQGCVAVQAYDKSSKSWSEPLRKACSAMAAEWGANAKSLVVLNSDGSVVVLK